MADYENHNLWRHFLSSLQKSTKTCTPEKQKDTFLGSVDCFSTSLSRRLLETSGQGIETKLTLSALKEIESGAHRFIANKVSESKSESENRSTTLFTNTHMKVHQASGNEESKMLRKISVADTLETGTGNVRHTGYASGVVQNDSSSVFPKVSVQSKQTSGSTDIPEAFNEMAETEGNSSDVTKKKSKITHDGASDGAFSTTFRETEDTAAVPSNSYTSCKQYSSGKKSLDSMIKPQMAKTSTSVLPPEAFTNLNEDVETNRTRKRNVNTNKRKKDVDIPCSEWTLDMLSDYVDFKQSVGEIKLENGGSPDIIDRIVSRALKQIKSVQRVIFARNSSTPGHRHPKTDSGNIYDLSGIRGTEADIRILLDAVLIPFAEELELTIETEKSYRNKNLPNCTFDYRLHYKHDVVGLVEAKSRLYGNGLGPESVVQGILQLSALQAEVYGRRSKTLSSKHLSSIPFFNIISDGYQFTFMQLDHDKLRFDRQPGRNIYGDDMSTLKVHIMDSQKGIETILERLAKLMFQVIRSIDQTEENEDDETDDERMEAYGTDRDGTIILD